MKVITSVMLAVIVLAAYATANPASKTDSCQKACKADDYTPICGKPVEGKGTDITFGSKCVLDNYNCEKKDKPYAKATDGECPGKAPVRL